VYVQQDMILFDFNMNPYWFGSSFFQEYI